MGRATLILRNDAIRDKAVLWAKKAPDGTRLEFKAPKRTVPQNARMWAHLTDIATQVLWHGVKLSPDDWKLIFLDGLKAELRLVPNLNGNGFVNLGRSSSDLSVSEMADLITLIQMFGANHGVVFSEPDDPRARER